MNENSYLWLKIASQGWIACQHSMDKLANPYMAEIKRRIAELQADLSDCGVTPLDDQATYIIAEHLLERGWTRNA